MNPQIKEFYRVLDIEPSADLASVRESYRQLVKVWHPDRFGHDQKLQALATEKLKRINTAYEAIVSYSQQGKKPQPAASSTPGAPPKTPTTPTPSDVYEMGVRKCYGDAKDYQAALKLFLVAAEAGHSGAQYAAGYIYYQHTRRNLFTLHAQYRNDHEAFRWWGKAARLGNGKAQYMLGICYQYGYCTPYNEAEATKWFTLAGSNGYPYGLVALRKMSKLSSIRAVPFVKWAMDPPPSAPPP